MAAIFNRMLAVCAASLITLAAYAATTTEWRDGHPASYVVRSGDTLWDIAGRFLQRPWLWPEIWQANPQIENPHLIYPGDVISLAYLNGERKLVTEPGTIRSETPIDAIPLTQIEPFLKKYRVLDAVDSLPHIVALEEDRLRATGGQLAYARGIADAQPGQRYTVVRPTLRYTQAKRRACCYLTYSDDLDFRGRRTINFQDYWTNAMLAGNSHELLGFEVMELATVEVTRSEGAGIGVTTLLLTEDSHEVREGDRLLPVQATPFDLQFVPHPPATQQPYGKVQVIAVADALTSSGPRYVVAISGGAREGIDNGTVFSAWREGTNTPDRVLNRNSLDAQGDKVRLPDEFAGNLMVFRTFDKVSYALVMDGIKPIRVGYHLKHPDATR